MVSAREEGNGIPSTVQVRNRRNIRQAKRRRVEETPVYIEEDPVEDNSAPRTSTNINISCGFPVQEPSKGRKNRNVTDSPDRENLRRPTSRRTRHATRRDGRSSNRGHGSGQLEQTVASTELLSALVENSLGVTGDGHVTNGCHGDDDVTGNADPSAEGDRLLHVLGEASLGLLGQSTENIGDPVAVCNSGVPKTEAQVGDKPLLSSHGHNADEGSREDDQRSDTLGPTISEAEPLDISKEQEQMTVDLLTTEDEVPADIGTAVRVKEKVEFWLKHHSLHPEVNNKSDTEPVGMDELDPYEFIGSQQDPAKEKKKPKIRVKKVRKPAAAGKRNQKTPTTTKMSSGPSKGKPGKSSAKQVEEVDGVEEEYAEQDQEVSSAASMTDGSEASWKPGQSDPDWGKGRTSRRRSAETKADEESVSSKGRRRKQTRAVDNEDQLTVSSGSSSQLRIDRWVQRKEKVFVKSYSKPVLSEVQSPGQHTSQRTPASLHSSGKDSTPGEVPPTPGEMFPTPPLPSTPLSSSGQKAAADRNRLSTRRRRSQLRSPESTASDHPTSPQNTPSTPGLLKSPAAGTKSRSCATPTVPPDAVDSGKETPKSCSPESDVSTHCSQRTTQSDYREHLDSNVVPDSEENVSRKGKRRSSSMQNTSNSEASPKTKVTSPSTMLQQSFPDSGNTEASVSLLENVKLQTKASEVVSQQKRKSPRLSREVSDIDKNENSSREVTQKLEQTKAEETNSGSHLKEQTRGGKGEDKPDNMEPTENVVATQATINRQGQKSEENKDQDLTEEVKQNVQVENNEQEIEDAQEEDGTEDEEDDDSEEDDLVPPTPPDTSFTQLTQRTKTVKSKPRIPERFVREDVQENNRQPVVIEEEENRECGWSDDDEDELPDLDDNHQVSPTCHSNTATPKNRSEKQTDIKEAVKESQDDISQATDTDINTHTQSKRRKETSAVLDMKDEATDESLPKRRKSEGNTEPESENKRNPIADAFDVTACLENNEESDLSQDSHAHDLTNASTLSELYDTQHQDKLKNDVQHLEGQMAMIQMLLAKGKERAREKGKEENNREEQHLTTVHEENMQVSEGDQEEILSGKDLYGTPSSQASAKDIYSTAQEVTTPKKLRSSSTPVKNHSLTKEYNFRKRVLSPQRSQDTSAKSQKSRRSQSSPRSSQPCLSPRSPSPPPTFSPEKTRTPRALPTAVQAAASLLEKFKSPHVSAEGKRRNSGNSTPLGKDDTIETRLSPRMKKGSTSPSDRKNTNPRSSVSSKKSNSKSLVSPRRKKQRGLVQDEDRGDDDTLPVEDIAPTVVKNRRSLNRKKSNSLKDVFSDEEDEAVTRCDNVPPASDGDENDLPTSGELRDDVCEPEEVSTNWKAFQQMKCDILAQKSLSPSKRQNKEAPKRLSLPTTQKLDKSSSDKRKSEPAIPSSQFDRNGITENPSTPQPRKTPLTFSQQPSPSVRKPLQSVPSKKDSPRIRSSYKSPTNRTAKENTERMTSTLTEKSTDSAAGQTSGVKNEWQDKNHASMTFVTTGLSKEETRAVHELAKKTGSRVKQTFDNSTTHVITRTDVDLFCSRTLKFFLGIAGRKWIVSFQWISACLEEGKHVPEEPFEVRGDLVHGCHGGPRQARNNKGKLLLSNYEICIYGKFTALTRDDLQFMVELCGGTVIKEPHMFPHDKKPLIVSQVDANQLTEEDYNAFYRRYGVLSVTRDWILDSVSSYQVQPISRYLMCSTQNQNVIVID
ncbi:Breast cancer 1, early onset [Branchiostoma belcheri]|nr:Breast cancer 1, early onset [Branchiostoma belcheri]